MGLELPLCELYRDVDFSLPSSKLQNLNQRYDDGFESANEGFQHSVSCF